MSLMPTLLVFGPLVAVVLLFLFTSLLPMPDGFDVWRTPLRSLLRARPR